MFFGLFKNKSKAQDLWATATGNENGKPLIFRLRSSPPPGVAIQSYPTLMNIYWAYEPENDGGMPASKDNDGQIAFEDAIDTLDSPKYGYLMLVVTGNGRKEWIWYVKDEQAWLRALNQLLAKQRIFPIQIHANQDPEWSTYFQFHSNLSGA